MGLLKAPAAVLPQEQADPAHHPAPAGASPMYAESGAMDAEALLAGLDSMDARVRRSAARALGAFDGATPRLVAALGRESELSVQQALVGALTEIGSPDAVAALTDLLRADAAWLRNAALEALQAIGPGALAAVRARLADADPCTRISAVVTLSGLPGPDTEAWLIAMAGHETEVNVLAAIVEALDQVGGVAALPVLDQLAGRGATEPFLAFAAKTVSARLAGGAARTTVA